MTRATMIEREALLALAERVEKLIGPDREVDAEIADAVHWDDPITFSDDARLLPYTASLDAAMTLVPEGWNWMAGNRNQPTARAYVNNGELHFTGAAARKNPAQQWHEVVAATPALALTAAALRARAGEA